MAQWKKIIVSGSVADLNAINVDNFVEITPLEQVISSDPNQTFLTGSFSGDGSGLTGLGTDLTVIDENAVSSTFALIDNDLYFEGTDPIDTAVTTDGNGNPVVTISAQAATTTTLGVASFATAFFDVTAGAVSLTAGGVTETELNTSVAGTGLSGGGGAALSVDYGSTAGTAVEGDTTISITGTANEVEITGTPSQNLNSAAYTIGLPDNVDITSTLDVGTNATVGGTFDVTGISTLQSDVNVQGTVNIGTNYTSFEPAGLSTIGGKLVVDGDLEVNGATTVVNTTNLTIEDRFILLNSGSTATNDKGGLVVDEGLGSGSAFFYSSKNTVNRWGFNQSVAGTDTTADQTAYVAAVIDKNVALHASNEAQYAKVGNIRVETNGDIYIYS